MVLELDGRGIPFAGGVGEPSRCARREITRRHGANFGEFLAEVEGLIVRDIGGSCEHKISFCHAIRSGLSGVTGREGCRESARVRTEMGTVERLALRNKHRPVPVAGDIDSGDPGPEASAWKREIHAEEA